jgi:hypothetical protein
MMMFSTIHYEAPAAARIEHQAQTIAHVDRRRQWLPTSIARPQTGFDRRSSPGKYRRFPPEDDALAGEGCSDPRRDRRRTLNAGSRSRETRSHRTSGSVSEAGEAHRSKARARGRDRQKPGGCRHTETRLSDHRPTGTAGRSVAKRLQARHHLSLPVRLPPPIRASRCDLRARGIEADVQRHASPSEGWLWAVRPFSASCTGRRLLIDPLILHPTPFTASERTEEDRRPRRVDRRCLLLRWTFSRGCGE